MAKQTSKTSTPIAKKRSGNGTDRGVFSWLWRNLLMVAVLWLVFLIVFKINKKESELRNLRYEYDQLAQTRGNDARLREIQLEYNKLTQGESERGFFANFIMRYTAGYYWVTHDVAAGSLKQIGEINEKIESGQMKPLTREDKLGYKVGIYPLIKYINENTPENAVIFLPQGDSLLSNTAKWNFVYDPDWMEYFLYPRLCLTIGREDEYPELAKRATHVLIVQGKGYEKLKYDVPVEQRASEAILPIDHPPAPPAQPAQPKQ